MQCKANDWIRHADFGIGRVSQDGGDRLVIEFLNFGAMTILKTAGLKPAVSPPGVEYRTSTSRVPSKEEFLAGIAAYDEDNHLYFQALHNLQKNWGDPTKMA